MYSSVIRLVWEKDKSSEAEFVLHLWAALVLMNFVKLLAQLICRQCSALQLAKQNVCSANRWERLVLLWWLSCCCPSRVFLKHWTHSPQFFVGKKKKCITSSFLNAFLSYFCHCFQKTLTFKLLLCALFQWVQRCFLDMYKGIFFWLVLIECKPEMKLCWF